MKLLYSQIQFHNDFGNKLSPIIMLHGMLDSRQSWNDVAPEISNGTGRSVYWLDARNHGESPWTEDFDFHFMCQDLEDFMEDHGIPKAILIGSSMGGKTAMKLALEKPEKVEKLIIEDIVPKPFPLTGWKIVVVAILMLKEALGAIPSGADDMTARRAIAAYLKENLPHMSPMHNHEFGIKVMPLKKVKGGYQWKMNLELMEKILVSNENFDSTPTGVFDGETLFLYGTESYMKVAEDPLILQLFPRALRIPIEGAGHMVHFEKPQKFVSEIVKFINTENKQALGTPSKS